ncbi:MAG: hypothetical protein DRI24_22360, partial [Deltaproteobacteria bacterium]
MKLHVRKDLSLQGADAELREYLKALLTTVNPEYIDAKTFGRWTGGIDQFLYQFAESGEDMTLPRGLLDHVLNDLGREFEEILDERVTPAAEKIWPEGNIILRPDDQEPAVQELMSYDNGFLSAPAGSGKTVMGLEAARRTGLKALWLTHRNELKDQTIEEAVNLLEIPKDRIGQLHGKKWTIGEQLTVGMIPTLGKRDLSEIEDEFGIVIVDEAHHIPSRTFLEVVNQFTAKYVYGLTATAYRRDKLEAIMFNSIGPVVARIEHFELVEDEHLIIPSIKRRGTGWLPHNANALDYHEFMDQMIHSELRNRKIVTDVVAECANPGNTAIVLVSRTKHAEILTKLLKAQGLQCEFVVGSVDVDDGPVSAKGERKKKKAIPKDLRDKIVNDFKEGRLQVLVATYDLLAEGFNYRPLNRLFMASPIKWKGTVVQSLGRIQRPHEDKENAIAYDYVDW